MVCNCLQRLDSDFRRNDGKMYFGTFYESIHIGFMEVSIVCGFKVAKTVAVHGLKLVEDPAKRGNWKIETWGTCPRLPVRCTQTGAGMQGKE